MLIQKLDEKYISYVANIIKNRWEIGQEETMREIYRWLSVSDNSICFVGTLNDIPIGFSVFDTQSNVDPNINAWNRQLYVEPEYRGNEYGYMLTKERFTYAKSKGYRYIYLSTEAAKEYHEKYGWETIYEYKKGDKIITVMKYDLHTLS